MSLQMGCAKIDITPERPIPLSGFAVRGNAPYEAVYTPIYLRAYVFQQSKDGEGLNGDPVLVVSADLLWWGTDRMDDIRGTLAAKWGFKPECVILNATHSHSGPQPSFAFHRLLGTADKAYVDRLESKLYQAVEQCFLNMEPVKGERGTGECRNGVQRRKYVGDVVIGGANPEGPVDNEVNVVRYTRKDGTTKAVMVHYACHPVTTSANELSSEFTGHAMERLERELEGSVCLFLQGCCADINIYVESAVPSKQSLRELVAYFGERLADSVGAVLKRPMTVLPETPLAGQLVEVDLEMRPLATREQLSKLVERGESPYDEWASTMLEQFDSRQTSLAMEFTRVDLAEGLSLLGMNAEVVVEYGFYVKGLSPDVLPLGYTNGMIGYVPMAYQLRSNSYESDMSTYYFHMPARLEPEIEGKVLKTLQQLTEPNPKEAAQ